MRGQPNGTLLFVAPTPMQLDSEKLAENGWTADLLATTSDKTWVMEVPKRSGAAPRPRGAEARAAAEARCARESRAPAEDRGVDADPRLRRGKGRGSPSNR